MVHILLSLLLSAAIFTDIRSNKIPNWLTLSGWAVGLLYHALMGQGILFSAGGLGLGLGLFLIPYRMGGIGAGDVKLLAAIGAFVGPGGALWVALAASVLGGIYAIALLIANGCLRKTFYRYKEMAKGILTTRNLFYIQPFPEEQKLTLCYGIPTAIAAFLFLLTHI